MQIPNFESIKQINVLGFAFLSPIFLHQTNLIKPHKRKERQAQRGRSERATIRTGLSADVSSLIALSLMGS